MSKIFPMTSSIFSPPALKRSVQEALRNWHKNTPTHLLEELALVQARRTEAPHETTGIALRRMTNEVLLAALEALEKQDATGARLLRSRYLEQKSILQTAFTFNLSPDQVKKSQAQGILKLTEILWDQEERWAEEQARLFEIHLPPPTFTRLFGMDTAFETLFAPLCAPTSPWLITLVGMGGLGKTALAHTLAQHLARVYGPEHVRWVQAVGEGVAPAQMFASLMTRLADSLGVAEGTPLARAQQVRYRLKQIPHVIVIDNLETEAETSYLLEQLHGMANPSKFLLTTRSFPAPQAGMLTHRMAELSLEEASAFLRYHSQEVGLGTLAITEAADAAAIYTLTGGNPLALKLVTGLVALFPLGQVLTDLAQSRAGKVEDLYRHIYWKAWRGLTEDAQSLLEAMPLVALSGTLPTHLKVLSGLPEDKLWPALQALVTRSLVEVYGTTTERRYGIHALTRTFLQTEIIHWPPHDPA